MKKSQTGSDFGELSVTYRAERSFFGHTPLVLKSGIQKYGRQAKVDKGLWCLVEMDLFSLLEWDGPALDAYLKKNPEKSRKDVKQRAKSIRSNMINRLVVMMSEEVSVSAWWMPVKVRELYQRWCEDRGTPDSRKHLVDTYLYLTSQRMIRLISDLKSVYLLPPDYVNPPQMDDLRQIHAGIQALYPHIFPDQANVGDVDWDLSNVPENLQSYANGVIYNLEKGSDHVFYWVSKLCDIERNEWISKKNKKKFRCKCRHLKIVWKILHDFIDRHSEYEHVRETIEALRFFQSKMNHNEKPIYLFNAVLLLVRRNEIDWKSTGLGIDTPSEDVEGIYREHLAGEKLLIDDYILDDHTHGGKRSANFRENFAFKGAFIENENVDFLRPDYREIYVLLKQELDFYKNNGLPAQQQRWPLKALSYQVNVPIRPLSPATMAKIDHAPHGQKKTGKYKKVVYIVGDLVFKGPYTLDDKSLKYLIRNLKFTYALQLLEEALKLPEWARGSLLWDGIACWEDDRYYLVAPNVGKTREIPFDIVSGSLETDVPVVPRGGCVMRVSDAEKNGRLTDEIKIAALQHLYFRFLLGIGDSGTHNVLLREDSEITGRLIAGIDLEENRAIKDKESRLAHLFKKAPSKVQKSLYANEIYLISELDPLDVDQQLLDGLSSVGIDPDRVMTNIETWEITKPS